MKSPLGFTLIELLVVISIISLLSSIVLTSVNSARAKARYARALADFQQMKLAAELDADSRGGAYAGGSVSKSKSFSAVPSGMAAAALPGLVV